MCAVLMLASVPVPVALAQTGTPGNDRLVGGRGPDRLVGRRGDDLLIGNGGRDTLVGGPGADTLIGGAGPDRINAAARDRARDIVLAGAGNDVVGALDGALDRISCGPGRDRVRADRRDAVNRDCEVVRRG